MFAIGPTNRDQVDWSKEDYTIFFQSNSKKKKKSRKTKLPRHNFKTTSEKKRSWEEDSS
jgi:hypothetical protein